MLLIGFLLIIFGAIYFIYEIHLINDSISRIHKIDFIILFASLISLFLGLYILFQLGI